MELFLVHILRMSTVRRNTTLRHQLSLAHSRLNSGHSFVCEGVQTLVFNGPVGHMWKNLWHPQICKLPICDDILNWIWLWVSIHFMSRPQFFFNEAAGCVWKVWYGTWLATINWEKELMLDHAKGQELLVNGALSEEEHFNWNRGLDHSDEKARREEQSLLTFELEWP